MHLAHRLRGVAAAVALAWPAMAAAQYDQCRPVFDASPPAINACSDARRVSLALVGDILLHAPLQRRGYGEGFDAVWGAATPFLRGADIAYANFEGASAEGYRLSGPARDPGPVFDGSVYSSYPLFNYHPVVTRDLRAAGVDIVSTANNHALDRLSAGADATLRALQSAGIATAGTVARGAPRDFTAVTPSALGRIVWIACSYGTNGVPDPHGQVLLCFNDREELLATMRAQAARRDVAAVIVTPHWGDEYAPRPNAAQTALARALVAAGATAVIGTHPHVVQPWEVLAGPAGNVPVIYSTGNFVSGQPSLPRETGMLVWMELCRAAPGSDLTADPAGALRPRLTVARAGWVPLRMARTGSGPRLMAADTTGITAHAAPARDLIEGLVPGRGMAARLVCSASPAGALAVALQ